MVQINDDFHENLTLEKLDQIIAEYAEKTPAQAAANGSAHRTPGNLKD